MKRSYIKLSAIALATMLIAPAAIHAQDDKTKDKEKTDKVKETETIVITRKTDNNQKVTVEINGDKVTVNGKPIEDMKDGDITVSRHKGGNVYTYTGPKGNWSWNGDELFNENENAAMLGVVTEEVDGGVKVTDVTNESGAQKAGLKEDDIITKVDDKKIDNPDDLTKVIRGHKAGDKVNITYLRDKKEQKATAELTKWKGAGFNAFNMKMPNMDFDVMPKIQGAPRAHVSPGMYYSFDNRPKLGLSVQDTEDGKGVKVIDVDDEGNAKKAGVKENDVIVSVNDKEVNSADEVARLVREGREKGSIMLKVKRAGKLQNIEVKMPKKLKTADL